MNNDYQRPLSAGTRLHNQYIIEKKLGQGGFGISYLAKDEDLQREVVIKEFFPSNLVIRQTNNNNVVPLSDNAEKRQYFEKSRARFVTEARALAKFDEPGIAKIYTNFSENDTAYLVMQYKPGKTLSDYLQQQGALTEPQLKDIFSPLINGLAQMHQEKLLHLDIKPDNIYIPDQGSPYLIDFGGVRYHFGQETQDISFMVATPEFAPPEQYSQKNIQGDYTDVYALGMTLYYAISLINLNNQKQEALTEIKDFPKGYSSELYQLIINSIQPNYEERLQDLTQHQSYIQSKKTEPIDPIIIQNKETPKLFWFSLITSFALTVFFGLLALGYPIITTLYPYSPKVFGILSALTASAHMLTWLKWKKGIPALIMAIIALGYSLSIAGQWLNVQSTQIINALLLSHCILLFLAWIMHRTPTKPQSLTADNAH